MSARGGDVERAHRQLLRLGGLPARVESFPDRARQQGIVEQVGEGLAEVVFAGTGEALAQVLDGGVGVGHMAPDCRGGTRRIRCLA